MAVRYTGMETVETKFTRREWELLPEGFPAQLLEGRLIREAAPTYGHQYIAARIRHALLQHVGPDRVPDTPADILVDDHNILQPDIVVLAEPGDVASPYVPMPRLVVEVLSPSTRRRDRGVKAGLLLGAGVGEVWLVDPEARTIEIRSTEGSRVVEGRSVGDGSFEGGSLKGSGVARSEVLPGFEVVADDLFAPPR